MRAPGSRNMIRKPLARWRKSSGQLWRVWRHIQVWGARQKSTTSGKSAYRGFPTSSPIAFETATSKSCGSFTPPKINPRRGIHDCEQVMRAQPLTGCQYEPRSPNARGHTRVAQPGFDGGRQAIFKAKSASAQRLDLPHDRDRGTPRGTGPPTPPCPASKDLDAVLTRKRRERPPCAADLRWALPRFRDRQPSDQRGADQRIARDVLSGRRQARRPAPPVAHSV